MNDLNVPCLFPILIPGVEYCSTVQFCACTSLIGHVILFQIGLVYTKLTHNSIRMYI